jgi:hypothetical protein
MTTDLTVTIALPPRGSEEAVLRVAANYKPSLLRIIAGITMPDFRWPFALRRFLRRRDQALQRLDDAAALARTMVGPRTTIETNLVMGPLSDYLSSGVNPASVVVVPNVSYIGAPMRRRATRDGRVLVADAEPDVVMSQ